MNPLWQRRLHRCARALGWTAGVAVIVLAVLMALTQLLLPLLGRHPQWVAAQLSAKVQRPVSFQSLEGHWTGSGPLFVMRGVTVGVPPGEAGAPLQIPEAEMKLDFGGWLLPSRHLLNLHVRGLQIDLTHDAGGWHVNGIGVAGGGNRQPLSFRGISLELWLEDLRLVVTDSVLNKRYTFLASQLRMSRLGSHIRVAGLLHRDGVAAALRTAGRFRDDGSDGRLWVGVDDVDLGTLLDGIDMGGYTAEQGRGHVAAWMDWSKGRLAGGLIRFDLDRLSVNSPTGATANVATLHGLAGLHQSKDGYDLRWVGDDGSALAMNLHQLDTPEASVGVAASRLQIAPLLPWLALKPDLGPTLATWVGSGHPRGELDRVSMHWNHNDGVQAIDVAFRDLGIDAVGKLPGLTSLRGQLRGDAEAMSLDLPQQPTTVAFPHAFRQPFVLSKLGGTLAFWPQDGDWHIGADALDFTGADFTGQARGEVTLPSQPGAQPFLDVYASIGRSDIAAAKLFWPNSMPPQTVAWLDHAIVSGMLDEAQALVRGSLADWPFHDNAGRFEARAVLSGLNLDYGKDWPRAENVSAVANFINNGMLVEASAGQSLGVKVDKAVALIPDFANSMLDLNVDGSGSGANLMTFARKSPIGNHQADTLAKLNLGGNGTFSFHLALPLKKDGQPEAELDGTAQLHDVDANAPDWNLHFDKLNGPLQFNLHGMQGGPLDTQFRGQPSTLQLSVAGANADPDTVFSAKLEGNYAISEMVQDYPSLQWLDKLSQGRSDFTIGFAIAHAPGSEVMAQALSIDSPLTGIALDLPIPLHKDPAQSLPLHLSMSLPVSGSDLQIAAGDVTRARFRLPGNAQQPLAATLAFGNQMPTTLPARGLRIVGRAAQLDVTGWVQHVAAGKGGDSPGLESIDVSADDAKWFGHSLGGIHISAKPQADSLSIDVAGAAMSGNFSVPTQDMDKRGVTARLQRLYWPKDPASANHPNVTPTEPVVPASGSLASGMPPKPADNPANTGINPAALPPFHLWVGDLRLGDAKLGEARLETWPTPNGMHIEQLRALSKQVQITASGAWNGTATDSHTHMHIDFSSDDLGRMLGAFGFGNLVNGGKTSDQLDATWPGSPSALSLANMDGTLNIKVNNGRIPEATSPGAGRFLGLVSLAELPRRLTLDFGDVFGKGLAFDSITGDFHLANGNATTDNLHIDGSSANITITGRAGLRARDFDQEVKVVPHLGNSLPIVGAVVAGPIGAAAGFAVQGLLGRGLNQVATARYKVTGSWDKPVMTLIEKHGVPAAASAPASSLSTPALGTPASTAPPLKVPYQPGVTPASGSSTGASPRR